MKNIRMLFGAFLLLLAPLFAFGQATTTSTTLSAAVTSASATTITVASATGFTANTTVAYVDQELMRVLSVSGTTIGVSRGASGTRAQTHTSGETVYVGPATYFIDSPKGGSCTSANERNLPQIYVATGDIFRCTNSEWDREIGTGRVKSKLDLDLSLESTSDGRQVELNSRNFAQTSGDSIGFRSASAQNVTSTGSLFGGQITPRLNNDIDIANVIGLHVDAYLRGTATKTISGDVRGQQIELVTDDAGTNTVSGNVTGLRFRAAFSATTLTGDMEAIRIETAEAQTNSQQWDQVLTLTGAPAGIWNATPGTEPSTADGYIKVKVNGVVRYIQLYSTAPTD